MNFLPLYQALILGLLQGVAELFPVSSLAQTILIPSLLGWKIEKGAPFLAFVVALHFATALALILYFWRDWLRVAAGFFRGLVTMRPMGDRDSRLAWLLIVGTVVVGIIGKLYEVKIRDLFEDQSKAWIIGGVLLVNGLFMLLGDVIKKAVAKRHPAEPEHETDVAIAAAMSGGSITPTHGGLTTAAIARTGKKAEELTLWQAFSVGAMQAFALVPGISRSGFTIVGGLLAGLTYEQASRFSFMLATPVIFAAAALKLPELRHVDRSILKTTVEASAVSFVAAYLSIRFLMRYFHTNRLAPFAWFCIIFGIVSAVLLRTYPQGQPSGRVPEPTGTTVVEPALPTTR